MGWSDICMQGKTDLYIVQNSTLTAVQYINYILDVYVPSYDGAIDPDFILMDDNTRPQRAQVTNEYMQTATIAGMDWPARSSDRNPIGHARDILQFAISDCSVQPTKVSELQQALLDQRVRIPQKSIRRRMRRRCRSLIKSNGHHSRY